MVERTDARGPRVTRDEVLRAALRIIDSDGIGRLTMRRLGAELGADAMMVYRFFESKAAVLDGVMGVLWAEVEVPESLPNENWQDLLARTMHGLRLSLLRHPRAISVIGTRPASGDATFCLMERLLGALVTAGMPIDPQTADMLNAVVNYTVGHVLAEAGEPVGGDSAEHSNLTVLASNFPHLASVFNSGWAYDAGRQFDRALRAMIGGWASAATQEAGKV